MRVMIVGQKFFGAEVLKLCLARGERQEAQQHMQAMYAAIQQRYAARHPKQEGGQP